MSRGRAVIMPDKGFQAIVVVLGVGLLAFFVDLGQEVRIDGREATHAEISREMAETGNYAVPYLLGSAYTKKPPLFNWAVAGLFELTGRSDFAVSRLPSAVSALAIMLGIYILGGRWLNRRAGLWAALAWPTFLLVQEWSRLSRGDMMMAALIFWAILFADFAAAATRQRASAAFWCAASLLVAGAVMSKGLQALVFFAIPVAGTWRARRRRWLPPGAFLLVMALVVVAAVAGWSWAAEAGHPGHMRELLKYQFGQGFGEHPKRLVFYFDRLVLTTLPWSLFAVGAVIYVVRRFRRAGYGVWAVPALTLGVCVVILTLTLNKRAHYALPLLPMWALFLSAFMDAGASRPRSTTSARPDAEVLDGERLLRWSFDWPLRGVLLCILALLLIAPVYWVSHAHSGKVIGAAALIAAAAAAACGVVASWRGNLRHAVDALLTTVVFLTIIGHPLITRSYLKAPEELKAITQITRAIPADVPVGEYRVPCEILYLKMNRRVAFLHDEAELRAFLQGRGERYLIARAQDDAALAQLAGRPLRVVGAWPMGGKGEISAVVLATSP